MYICDLETEVSTSLNFFFFWLLKMAKNHESPKDAQMRNELSDTKS